LNTKVVDVPRYKNKSDRDNPGLKTLYFMMRFKLLLFSGILLCSCINKGSKLEMAELSLSAPEKYTNTRYFTEAFELAEIVPIQTSNTYLVSDIKRVIKYKEIIILLSGSNNQVFIIDSNTGKIKKNISKLGSGPGESRTIMDIAFDESIERILVLNDYNKLLVFNLDGELLDSVTVEDLYEEMTVMGDEVFFWNILNGYSCFPYKLDIYNIKNKSWKTVGNNIKKDFSIRDFGRYLVKSKNIWFTSPLDFDFFSYTNGKINTAIELDMPEKKVHENLIKKSISDPRSFFNDIFTSNLIFSINSVRETQTHLVFKSNLEGIFIMNKNNKKVYWEKITEKKFPNMDIQYYPHDGDDDKLMFILTAEELIRGSVANSDFFNIKEDDNPVLIFYREKR